MEVTLKISNCLRYLFACIGICLVIIFSFLISHLHVVGSFNFSDIKTFFNPPNVCIISSEDMVASLKDFTVQKEYIKSESNDPWFVIDDNHNHKFLSVSIDNLSEVSVITQLFYYSDDGVIEKQSFTTTEGINVYKLTSETYNSLRVDLVNKKNVYALIDNMKLSDNYLFILPAEFWLVFVIVAIIGIVILLLSLKGLDNSKTNVKQYKLNLNFVNNFKEQFATHKSELIVAAIVELFIFGYEIFNFTLSVDEEREIVYANGTSTWIEKLALYEGRWAAYLFKSAETLDGIFTPFVETFLSVVFLYFAATLLLFTFEKCSSRTFNKSTVVIFIGLFSSLPCVVTEWMCYSIINSIVSFGILLISFIQYIISIWFSETSFGKNESLLKKYGIFIVVIPILSFTFGLFETMPPLFITATCFALLINAIYSSEVSLKSIMKRILPYLISFVIAFVLYYLIRSLFNPSDYVNQLVAWGNEDIKTIFGNWAILLNNVFNSSVPGSFMLLMSVAVLVLIVIVTALNSRSVSQGLIIIFLGFCTIIAAFSLNIITGGITPQRTRITLMLLCSVPWVIVLEQFRNVKVLNICSVILSAALLWNQMVWMNRIWIGANLCWQLDINMSYKIGTDIINECPEYSGKPVVFCGRYQHKSPSIIKIDAVGQSIFYRNKSQYPVYMLKYLGFDFDVPNSNLDSEAIVLAESMNSYPQDGYIQEFEDVIVVKLS